MKTIILAGGRGTRLWPLSRELEPKQFAKLVDEESLFQKAVRRALLFSQPEEIIVVTNEEYRFRVGDEVAELGIDVPLENILLEPAARNTLPAIYWGMKTLVERFGPCQAAVLPADHLVEADEGYRESFRNAEKAAHEHLVTFGVPATKPVTGYGYIKPGQAIEGGLLVDEFKEKPDEETARTYVEEGHYWNSGMFYFDSERFFSAVRKLAPKVAAAFDYPLAKAYEVMPTVSVDYGLLEKAGNVAVVPLATSWSDVGSFDALYDVIEKNGGGNAVRGEYRGIDSANNLVLANRLTATIGIQDTLIIDTDDALLIANRGESQKVKAIQRELAERGDERAIVHRTARRPWGCYTVLEDGTQYKIKRLVVDPGKKLSLQRHERRSEHWVVVKGSAEVVIGEETVTLESGQSTYIPAGQRHRLANANDHPLEIIEVQIGDYLGEDDIERFDDDFGRA